jgi:hypothetical protein
MGIIRLINYIAMQFSRLIDTVAIGWGVETSREDRDSPTPRRGFSSGLDFAGIPASLRLRERRSTGTWLARAAGLK